MNKILLITTKGCGACKTMRNLISSALKEVKNKKIQFDEQDVSKLDKGFLKENEITDFPTMVFFRNENLVFQYSGTMPAIVIFRWIENFF